MVFVFSNVFLLPGFCGAAWSTSIYTFPYALEEYATLGAASLDIKPAAQVRETKSAKHAVAKKLSPACLKHINDYNINISVKELSR